MLKRTTKRELTVYGTTLPKEGLSNGGTQGDRRSKSVDGYFQMNSPFFKTTRRQVWILRPVSCQMPLALALQVWMMNDGGGGAEEEGTMGGWWWSELGEEEDNQKKR